MPNIEPGHDVLLSVSLSLSRPKEFIHWPLSGSKLWCGHVSTNKTFYLIGGYAVQKPDQGLSQQSPNNDLQNCQEIKSTTCKEIKTENH